MPEVTAEVTAEDTMPRYNRPAGARTAPSPSMRPDLATLLAAAPPPEGSQTRMLRSPTVSATQIAFAYANNIWTVERAGGRARRLTSFQGQTSNPHFSPDGNRIAFTGQYSGNADV